MNAAAFSRREVPEGMRYSAWHAPDGWSLRRFDWPAASAARGSLLFLGGRGDFVEKYLEALAHWHGRGWSLTGFDWRGQGGSGRFLADPLVCHLPTFEPLLDDLDAFVREWTATAPAPHFVVAHSMGAHLVLRLLAEHRVRVGGAALLSPMIGIGVKGLPARFPRMAAAAAVGIGLGERRIWGGDIGNHGGRMTACAERQADKIWWKVERPELASGAPSWAWLKAACASIERLQAAAIERVDVPLLLLASRRDSVIDVDAACRAAGRLPRAELHLLDGTGHELLREADLVRLPVLRMVDDFAEGL